MLLVLQLLKFQFFSAIVIEPYAPLCSAGSLFVLLLYTNFAWLYFCLALFIKKAEPNIKI